ncbi:MAG: c-type cytochrome biogenesis protein CcsB [Micrococcales bacterium]|nr:c-type cytochrome biogenesis protein CcsB [Micrococcales bacterium]
MTNETLAGYSNLALYSAMGVLTLAMIAYAVFLARLVPHRERLRDEGAERVEVREAVHVGAGAPAAGGGASARPAADGAGLPAEPLAARKAAGVAGSLTWLGTGLLIASVALRGLSVDRAPLGNMFEFACAATAFALAAYLVWGTRRDLRWLGLFILVPIVLILGAAMTVWYAPAAELLPSLKSYWLAIHVTVATLSVGLFTLGAVLSLLYLWQEHRATNEITGGFMSAFPAGKTLERMAYGVHIIAFPLWTFTLIAGAIWARQAWGSYWNWDPKEVWTFVIWVIYAAYLHARATSGWSRQAANWIAIAGFLAIIANYAIVNVYFVGQHSYSGL